LDEAVFVENYIGLVARKNYICEGLRAFWNGWRVELFSSAACALFFVFPVVTIFCLSGEEKKKW